MIDHFYKKTNTIKYSEADGTDSVLRNLFSPVNINKLEMPNRVMMSSMHLNMDTFPDQYERMAHFYVLRAKSNIGLIVTAGCSPNLIGRATECGFSLEKDALISEHQKITTAVHEVNGRIALQMLHFGSEASHGELVSASSIRLKSSMFTPRALTDEDIWQTIQDYANTAARAIIAGYDAIELIFSQGFLVHQFLAKHTNHRNDQWGGNFGNRARFAVEIAQAVRKMVGDHFPIIFRIPCLDLLNQGLSMSDTVSLIQKLLPFSIDLLNVSIGWHESVVPTISMVVPRAGFNPVAVFIRKQFPQLKVAISNRINDPRVAEQLLIDNCADVVAIGRPFLSDPDFLTKAHLNLFDEINTCIACNQSCLDYVFIGRPVGCSVNPDCGLKQEGEYSLLPVSSKIAVVGGGIAGMAAALLLAKRGARVSIFEQEDRLGGQLNLAALIPDKTEFLETIRYYRTALKRMNVDIHYATKFTEQHLKEGSWSQVVLATGSKPKIPTDILGIDKSHVYSYLCVLQKEYPITFPVVIIGGGGVACDIANYIVEKSQIYKKCSAHYLNKFADQFDFQQISSSNNDISTDNYKVSILQRSTKKLAHKVGRTTRWILMKKLAEANISVCRGVSIIEILSDKVKIINRFNNKIEFIPAKTVILATGHAPQNTMIEKLQTLKIPYSLVGAATGDSNINITTATADAYKLAMNIK
jgi:2,4-dienoyl-CoA reductase (NADPH2)